MSENKNNKNNKKNKNIKLENIIDAKYAEDLMDILENTEFAVYASEN